MLDIGVWPGYWWLIFKSELLSRRPFSLLYSKTNTTTTSKMLCYPIYLHGRSSTTTRALNVKVKDVKMSKVLRVKCDSLQSFTPHAVVIATKFQSRRKMLQPLEGSTERKDKKKNVAGNLQGNWLANRKLCPSELRRSIMLCCAVLCKLCWETLCSTLFQWRMESNHHLL